MKYIPDEKILAYENLIRRSLPHPWSDRYIPVENAYCYYRQLYGQGKTETARRQFMLLKNYLVKAVKRIIKKTKSKAVKNTLFDILLLLELAENITDIDDVITATLMIAKKVPPLRKS